MSYVLLLLLALLVSPSKCNVKKKLSQGPKSQYFTVTVSWECPENALTLTLFDQVPANYKLSQEGLAPGLAAMFDKNIGYALGSNVGELEYRLDRIVDEDIRFKKIPGLSLVVKFSEEDDVITTKTFKVSSFMVRVTKPSSNDDKDGSVVIMISGILILLLLIPIFFYRVLPKGFKKKKKEKMKLE